VGSRSRGAGSARTFSSQSEAIEESGASKSRAVSCAAYQTDVTRARRRDECLLCPMRTNLRLHLNPHFINIVYATGNDLRIAALVGSRSINFGSNCRFDRE
jgi:hypothetical protein